MKNDSKGFHQLKPQWMAFLLFEMEKSEKEL